MAHDESLRNKKMQLLFVRSALEKILTRALGLLFGSEIFDFIIFCVWKKASYFLTHRFSNYVFGLSILHKFIFGSVQSENMKHLQKLLLFSARNIRFIKKLTR